MLVSIDKSSERSTTTPVAIYLEAAREKLTGDADFTIDLVIDVDTAVGWVTFPDTTVIEVPIHASFRARIATAVENVIRLQKKIRSRTSRVVKSGHRTRTQYTQT